jgi:microcystin-dependent protein
MKNTAISAAGGSTPVSIVPPVLCVNFIIATVGLFPTRN